MKTKSKLKNSAAEEKLNVKIFYEPVFYTHVTFLVGPLELVNEYFSKKKLIVGDLKNYNGMTMDIGCEDIKKRSIYLWVRRKDDFYSLQHETIHLIKYACDHVGIDFRAENDEFIAYYQNYWFKQLWRCMAKWANIKLRES